MLYEALQALDKIHIIKALFLFFCSVSLVFLHLDHAGTEALQLCWHVHRCIWTVSGKRGFADFISLTE